MNNVAWLCRGWTCGCFIHLVEAKQAKAVVWEKREL